MNACIDLKELGYAERDSLAASFGEKSQILAAKLLALLPNVAIGGNLDLLYYNQSVGGVKVFA